MERGQSDKKNADRYMSEVSRNIVQEAAAECHEWGVPWEEAVALAQKAVGKAQEQLAPMRAAAKPKAKSKGQPKAKNAPKAKPRAA